MEDTGFHETCLRDKRTKGGQIFLEYESSKDTHNFPFCMKNKKFSKIAAFKNCSSFTSGEKDTEKEKRSGYFQKLSKTRKIMA